MAVDVILQPAKASKKKAKNEPEACVMITRRCQAIGSDPIYGVLEKVPRRVIPMTAESIKN